MIVAGVILCGAGVIFALLMAVWFGRRERVLAEEVMRRRIGAADKDAAPLLRSVQEDDSRVARLLIQSGLGWEVSAFWNRTLLCGSLGLILGEGVGGVPMALLAGLGGGLVFPIMATLARGRRMTKMDQQFPEAVGMMVLALRAGHALPGALQLAAREAPPPLRAELADAVKEHGLGRPISSVLARLAERLPGSDSAQNLAVAVNVLEQTGGNLIAVLDRICGNARAHTQYLQRLRALTAQGRMSAYVMGAIPPIFAALAAWIDPNYLHTLSGKGGTAVIAIGVALWLAGCGWTALMVKKQMAA